MKTTILLLAILSIGCSKPELPEQQTQATYCGTVYALQSEYLGATFQGIRYMVNLTPPVIIGATTYTRGNFILNDALNTQSTEQFTIHNNVCSASMNLTP